MKSKYLLGKEITKLKREIEEINRFNGKNYAVWAVKCAERAAIALKRYVKTQNKKDMGFTRMWDKAGKIFIQRALKQHKGKYGTNNLVEKEQSLRELRNKINMC